MCVEVSKGIHANFFEIDSLKIDSEELREQLKTVKAENKQKENRITLLMKKAEEL